MDAQRGGEVDATKAGDGFLLYSVGGDGKDDGGDPAWERTKGGHHWIWDGRDAVWPAPAGAEEAKRAVTGRPSE